MPNLEHDGGFISGFNERKQLELAIQAAEKMVGSATMSMDPETRESAERCILDARQLLDQYSNSLDASFLKEQEKKLHQCEHQLREAENPN